MKHLTTAEIITFVMLDDTLSEEEHLWAMEVNKHIRSCPTCLQAVQTFGRLYDRILDMRDSGACAGFLSSDEQVSLEEIREMINSLCSAEDLLERRMKEQLYAMNADLELF